MKKISDTQTLLQNSIWQTRILPFAIIQFKDSIEAGNIIQSHCSQVRTEKRVRREEVISKNLPGKSAYIEFYKDPCRPSGWQQNVSLDSALDMGPLKTRQRILDKMRTQNS